MTNLTSPVHFRIAVLLLVQCLAVATFAEEGKVSDEFKAKQKPILVKLLKKGKQAWASKDKAVILDFMIKHTHIRGKTEADKKKSIERLKAQMEKASEKALASRSQRFVKILGMMMEAEPQFQAVKEGMVGVILQKDKYKMRALYSNEKWELYF